MYDSATANTTTELRLKAERCRRLAGTILSAADPTRISLLGLAAELETMAIEIEAIQAAGSR